MPVSKAGLAETGVGGESVWVTVATIGVDGDPQAEMLKESKSKMVMK